MRPLVERLRAAIANGRRDGRPLEAQCACLRSPIQKAKIHELVLDRELGAGIGDRVIGGAFRGPGWPGRRAKPAEVASHNGRLGRARSKKGTCSAKGYSTKKELGNG